ncbi:MAG: hypothetical protein EOP09_04400 [Proteobacteria bacterium]|nr:MAG: hypothetical protein EOP09_04400 [Pseudomonadota bacterium]
MNTRPALLLLALFSTSAQADERWKISMRTLENSLQNLLVETSSAKRFAAAVDKETYQKEISRFVTTTAEILDRKDSSGDKDPSIGLIGTLFKEEAQHLKWASQGKNKEYARHLVLSLQQYCVACHTRSPGGIEFSSRSGAEKLDGLEPTEKAAYLVSTRQFDLALKELQTQIASPKLVTEDLDQWERASRLALSVSIRVKNDPKATANLLKEMLGNPNLPDYLKAQIESWNQSIVGWNPTAMPKTEKSLNSEANKLINEAKKKQEYSMDPSAQVYLLRASALLHEQLQKYPKGKLSTSALYQLGLAYETLESVGLYELKDYYYLLCMREAPHSTLGRSCYRQYERGVYEGYTGSGGTHIPTELVARLKELRELTSPEKKSGPSKPNL